MSAGLIEQLLGRLRGESRDPARTDGDERKAVTLDELERRYDPDLSRLDELCDGADLGDLDHTHLLDPTTADDGAVRTAAQTYQDRGVSAGSFVASHAVAVDGLVSATFDRLREELGDDAALDAAEADLSAALGDVLASARTGVDAVARPRAAADGGTQDAELTVDTDLDDADLGGSDDEAFPLGFREIIDHIGTAIFILDTDGDVVFWNRGAEQLTGEPRERAYEYELASEAFYHDGRRAKTLADKVLDAPESADDEYGVPRVDDVEYTLYRDRSTMTAAGGDEVHISFSAAPLYRDGELVGVVEMVQDRTEDVVLREQTAALVSELQDTIEEMQAGNYDARASFESQGYLTEEQVSVVDTLNELGSQFETLSRKVLDEMEQLQNTSETVTEASQSVNRAADDQDETMQQLSAEISNLSATVEEVASSAAQVDETSSRAETLAEDGRNSAEEAMTLLDDASESADTVTSDVDQLQSSIGEISEIVEVINDIADQTNILALNASIEAARAGEAGEGFAVVADEVKQLAEESQQHATEIEDLIEGIQDDTDETVGNLSETTDRIEDVIDQVEDAMTRLGDIVDAVSEASEGIQEVADATDDQAASTEEVASMIDEAAANAEDIAGDIEQIAEANQEQKQRATELREVAQEYMS